MHVTWISWPLEDWELVPAQDGTPSAASPGESEHAGRGTWDLKTSHLFTKLTQSLCAICKDTPLLAAFGAA